MNSENSLSPVVTTEQLPESLSRRAFFGGKSVAAAAVGAAVSVSSLAQAAVPGTEIDDTLHTINRLTMGVTPALYADVNAMGVDAFIEQQLDPSSIDDTEAEAMASQFTRLNMSAAELRILKKRGPIRQELHGATVIRAVHSNRQLKEVMVDFWSNHFNVDVRKKGTTYFKPADDKGIRELALGNFSDLLMFTAKSPAMLEYLDNRQSRANRNRIPNENYARELMELHTLGVDGGYSEDDVLAVSYVLSGWSVKNGEFRFNANANRLGPLNDGGDVMGWVPFAPERSVENGESFINFLAYQPATANFVCWKLCRYFVRDDIEQYHPLVAQVADVFSQNDTEIVPTLRAIFASDEFRQSKGEKVKRGNELMYSILRATGATLNLESPRRLGSHFRKHLSKMDHALFECEPPTGYPFEASAFINTNAMVNRWNVGFGIARNGISRYVRVNQASWINNPANIQELVEQLSERLMSRQLEESEKQALYSQLGKAPEDVVKRRDLRQIKTLAGLIFASSSFQIR